MRRNENWRWHDYHCHMDLYKYNFICQFPTKNHISNSAQSRPAAPLKIEQDDKVAVVVIIVIASVLLVVIILVLYILYRKQKHLKAEQHRIVRFSNVHSSTDISPPDSGMSQSSQPVSNIYLNPMDIIQDVNSVVYDELNYNKDSNLGVSSLLETTRLMYTSGATSEEDLDMPEYLTPMATCDALSATSADLQFAPDNANENYIEMNGVINLGYKNGTLVATAADGDNKYASATGSVNDLEPIGIYISPVQSDLDLSINASKCLNNGKCEEVHIYANKIDSCENLCNRPLPPVPLNA